MKQTLIFVVTLLLHLTAQPQTVSKQPRLAGHSTATQQHRDTATQHHSDTIRLHRLPHSLDATIGLAPQSPYRALKASFTLNNLLFRRIGVYTSIEHAIAQDPEVFHDYSNHYYFSHILGVSTTINEWFYLFGGVDIFTRSGIIYTRHRARGFRHEVGIGITPTDWLVGRLGWSKTVGLTLTVGFRFTEEYERYRINYSKRRR